MIDLCRIGTNRTFGLDLSEWTTRNCFCWSIVTFHDEGLRTEITSSKNLRNITDNITKEIMEEVKPRKKDARERNK
jgi:hypothetical protein